MSHASEQAGLTSQFLTHPQPLMFVAGLTSGASISRDRSASIISQPGSSSRPSSRRPSDAARRALEPNSASASGSASNSTFLDPSQSSSLNSLTTPLTSPSLGQRHAALPSSPPPLVSPPASGNVVVTAPQGDKSEQQVEMDKDFEKLVSDLRGALEAKSEKAKVWLPGKERKDFRILLVDMVCRRCGHRVFHGALTT
jgi:hypothetical protein